MAERRAARVVHKAWITAGWLLVAVVTWGSLTPTPPEIEPLFPQFDKLEHFSAYLAMTAWFAAMQPGRQRLLWIAALFVSMGGLIEIVQGLSGYRDAEWLDWLADCLGVAAALRWPTQYLNHFYMKLTGNYAASA